MSNFVLINKEKFEDYLSNFGEFEIVNDSISKEIIYDVPVENSKVHIRIYSSIDVATNVTRDAGEDAIRCVLFDTTSNKPIDKTKRTHRMENWNERLTEKITNLKAEFRCLKFCPSCGSAMSVRESSSGKFYGCLAYPNCKTTISTNGSYNTNSKPKPVQSVNIEIPHCPDCDAQMTKRNGRRGEFYGCSQFFKTGCKGVRQVDEVEIYGIDVEEEVIPINKYIEKEKPQPKKEQKKETKPEVKIIPTSSYPHLKFKFENFNPVQSEVFQYYDKDVNCVVAAATSAGKTTIAEMFMADSISKGKKAIFLSPLKAVSQEKYDDWRDESHSWSKMNVSIVTGDYALTEKRVEELNKANVVLLTTEMLDSRSRRINIEKNDWLLNTGTLVQDECFLESAQVLLENNLALSIKEVCNNLNIKYVLSYNEKTKNLEKKKILRRIKKLLSDKLVSVAYEVNGQNFSLVCTANHKIWTSNGYKQAKYLVENDVIKIFNINKTFIYNHDGIVKNVKCFDFESGVLNNSFVYNLEVEDNHNYIVDNVLVSNCHLITTKGRGDKVESAIMRFTKQNPTCRIVFLSATMSNVDELARWLTSLNGKKTELINSEYRPCQLDIHYEPYDDYGRYAQVEINKMRRAVEITQQYPQDKFITFVHAKRTGREIAKMLEQQFNEKVEIHNSELSLRDRIRVSNSFKQKDGLRIIVATSTLALGVNLPSRRVIIVGVHRGMSEVEPLDIKQMCGRSGRVGFDPKGDAHILLPQSKLTRYKAWCQNIPPIASTMNDQDILAFHIVSEIAEGEVYNIETLMTWYNRSLAAFQSNFLDRVDAESLMSKLEKMKIIEKQGDVYKITKLGKIASLLYYSPYSIAGWYFNFNRIFNERNVNNFTISWALSNISDNSANFIGRDMKDKVTGFITSCRRYGLEISEACASVGLMYYSCLSYDDDIEDFQKRSVKFDNERVMSALQMIDKMHAHWNKNDFWESLQLRIMYEVTEEQTEICSLKGIGGERTRALFDAGIRSKSDFIRKTMIAKDVLGEYTYNKVLNDNNLF